MLEKKECFLQKKASAEVEKAKDYTKAKNKSGKHFFQEIFLFVKKHLHLYHIFYVNVYNT
jgi:hypothetical protein